MLPGVFRSFLLLKFVRNVLHEDHVCEALLASARAQLQFFAQVLTFLENKLIFNFLEKVFNLSNFYTPDILKAKTKNSLLSDNFFEIKLLFVCGCKFRKT